MTNPGDRTTGDLSAEIERIGRELSEESNARRALEQRLTKMITDVETVAETKNEFLTTMSHEIRTPMNAIIGMTQLVLDTPLSPEQRDFLTIVRDSGTAMLTMINQILDFSQMEAGKLELQSGPFSLSNLIQRVTAVLLERPNYNAVQFVHYLDDDIPKHLLGDETRIGQVLDTLIGNAIKFTPQGGGVSLQVFAQAIRPAEVDLLFSVADTGIGISPDSLETIFAPFSRGENGQSGNSTGAGLGLTVTRHLVELMGGKLSVASNPGVGTAFQFSLTLPCSTSDELVEHETAKAPLAVPTASFRGPLKILVAEDQPVNQKLIARVLEKYGHSVTVANDGREALTLLQNGNHQFDLILMDCQMPFVDGFEAAASIRLQERITGTHVPIIAVTANALQGDEERCRAAGMDDYVAKPINFQDLLDKMSQAHARMAGFSRR